MTWTLVMSYDAEAVATTPFATAEEANAALEVLTRQRGLKPVSGKDGLSRSASPHGPATARVPLHHLMAVVVPPMDIAVLAQAALPWAGKRLQRAREALRLTRSQVAEQMGVLPATVGAWETDNLVPGNQRREALEAFIAQAAVAA